MFTIESGWYVLDGSDLIGPGPFHTEADAEEYITSDTERVEFVEL